jgi:guanine deaminase
LTQEELMQEACRLAEESVHNNWGGPFGAVLARDGEIDPVPERAKMLMGHEIYISGAPCPMCMSAIYWARIDAVYFAKDLSATSEIGFDDAFQYEDFEKPYEERRIHIEQFRPDLGDGAYRAWAEKPDKHPY